jgi:hypothetical protein
MVRLPEDKPALQHLAPGYDPAKAHAYYLRIRKLHPRQRVNHPLSGRVGPVHPVANPQIARQRQQIAAAITSLERKLNELKSVLARKKAALNRDQKLQKLTPAEKAKAARQSKQYRQKHKQSLKAKARQKAGPGATTRQIIGNPRSGSIKQVEAAIQTVEATLTAAKARQKALG